MQRADAPLQVQVGRLVLLNAGDRARHERLVVLRADPALGVVLQLASRHLLQLCVRANSTSDNYAPVLVLYSIQYLLSAARTCVFARSKASIDIGIEALNARGEQIERLVACDKGQQLLV